MAKSPRLNPHWKILLPHQINLALNVMVKATSWSGSIPGMAVRTMKSHVIYAIPNMTILISMIQEVQMQDNFIRITQQGFTKRPIRIMVVGYRYKVDFGPSVKPQVHLVDQQKHCSCELDTACPAIKAVAEYLCNGGRPDPAPFPARPPCGAETFHDRGLGN